MLILVLKLPDVKQKKSERPKACRYCRGRFFNAGERCTNLFAKPIIGKCECTGIVAVGVSGPFGIIQRERPEQIKPNDCVRLQCCAGRSG